MFGKRKSGKIDKGQVKGLTNKEKRMSEWESLTNEIVDIEVKLHGSQSTYLSKGEKRDLEIRLK